MIDKKPCTEYKDVTNITKAQKARAIIAIVKDKLDYARNEYVKAISSYHAEVAGKSTWEKEQRDDPYGGNIGIGYQCPYHPERRFKESEEARRILGEWEDVYALAITTFLNMIDDQTDKIDKIEDKKVGQNG